MKISTKGRYAVRLMLDLAMHNTGEAVSIKDISKRQGVSDKYLEQIISVLNKAGYVRSIRGAQGGYMLKKDSKDYTVGMILRLTEGSLAPVSCVDDDDMVCERENGCVTFYVWKKLNDAINGVVDSITLADLVEMQMQMSVVYSARYSAVAVPSLPFTTSLKLLPDGLQLSGRDVCARVVCESTSEQVVVRNSTEPSPSVVSGISSFEQPPPNSARVVRINRYFFIGLLIWRFILRWLRGCCRGTYTKFSIPIRCR